MSVGLPLNRSSSFVADVDFSPLIAHSLLRLAWWVEWSPKRKTTVPTNQMNWYGLATPMLKAVATPVLFKE